MFTKIFNDLVNGSLPGSIFLMSNFFITPENIGKDLYFQSSSKIKNTLKSLFLTDITYESLRNYHYLWYAFNNNMKTFTIFCLHKDNNCSDPSKYTFAFQESLNSLWSLKSIIVYFNTSIH